MNRPVGVLAISCLALGGLSAAAPAVTAGTLPIDGSRAATAAVAGTHAREAVGALRVAKASSVSAPDALLVAKASSASAPVSSRVAKTSASSTPVASAAATTVDDRALTRRGTWTSLTLTTAYKRTLSRTTKVGSSLTARTRAVNGGAFVVQVGPGRGTVEIRINGVRKVRVSSAATRAATKSIAFSGAGTVSLWVISAGRGVVVDSLRLNASAPAIVPLPRGALTHIGVNASGVGPNGGTSRGAAMSPGGTFVAFWSNATNLVPGVGGGRSHLYIATTKASKVEGTSYRAGQVLSAIASTPESGGGKLALSWLPALPGESDSTRLAFTTNDPDVLTGDTAPGSGPWAYVADLVDGSGVRLPLQRVGDVAPSPNGKVFAIETEAQYGSDANFNSDIWVYDPAAPESADLFPVSADSGNNFPVNPGGPTNSYTPVWAPDSTRIAFTSWAILIGGDTNAEDDIYVKNWRTKAITRISTSASGLQGNEASRYPAWSPDGTRIAFASDADNLIASDSNVQTDIFVKVLSTGQIIPVSVSRAGRYSVVGDSRFPSWSPDGKRIAFESSAVGTELLPNPAFDANLHNDIYVKHLTTGVVQLVSVRADAKQGNGSSGLFYSRTLNYNVWTNTGRGVLFSSGSSNFATSDANAFNEDLFLKAL